MERWRRDVQETMLPAWLAQALGEPDPEQLELARALLSLPSCLLRQADVVPRAGRGLAGERTWRSWGESIQAAGFATEPLGRYARSLRRLPRRYWRIPLAEFTSSSWNDMRRRPWWGKTKLELLRETLFDLVATMPSSRAGSGQLDSPRSAASGRCTKPMPGPMPASISAPPPPPGCQSIPNQFVREHVAESCLEAYCQENDQREVSRGGSWVGENLPVSRVRVARLYFLEQRLTAVWETGGGLEERVLRRELIPLLLDQLELDVGSRARRLLAHRLLPSGGSRTRDRHAAQLHFTRARYYQLLQESRAALRLRWPEGAWLFRLWAHQVSQRPDGDSCEQLLRRIDAELFGNSEEVEY